MLRPRRSSDPRYLVSRPVVDVARFKIPGVYASTSVTEEEALKGVAEGFILCINKRVEETVDVAEPHEYTEEHGRDAVAAVRVDDVRHEEWKPAKNKNAHDDGQGLCGFTLPGHASVTRGAPVLLGPVCREVVRGDLPCLPPCHDVNPGVREQYNHTWNVERDQG